MSLIGPKRRKTMSAPMSAIEVLSGLVVLTLSFVGHDPNRTSRRAFVSIRENKITQLVRIMEL
jgi:hypothetical protein